MILQNRKKSICASWDFSNPMKLPSFKRKCQPFRRRTNPPHSFYVPELYHTKLPECRDTLSARCDWKRQVPGPAWYTDHHSADSRQVFDQQSSDEHDWLAVPIRVIPEDDIKQAVVRGTTKPAPLANATDSELWPVITNNLTFDPQTCLPELTQNWIRSSHGHSTSSLKISCKSVQPFSIFS